MAFIVTLFQNAIGQVLVSLSHNWPYLAASVIIAAALKTSVDTGRVSAILSRFRTAGVLAATAAAVGTPLCSCGTTAVVLGMMATSMPLAPIVAFMVASPLSSPEGLVYGAGLFGWPFATAYFSASVLIGLAGGGIAALLEKTGFLKSQTRFAPAMASGYAHVHAPSCGCSPAEPLPPANTPRETWSPIARKAGSLGREAVIAAKKLLPMYLGFAFLGYLLNDLVPASWIVALFGGGHAYGVPLAATIGLPLYINSEASLPMARSFLDSGMSPGAIMAFLIAGSGTSMGAIAGALTIARKRVVGLVIVVLWAGAIIAGFGFDLLVSAGIA